MKNSENDKPSKLNRIVWDAHLGWKTYFKQKKKKEDLILVFTTASTVGRLIATVSFAAKKMIKRPSYEW